MLYVLSVFRQHDVNVHAERRSELRPRETVEAVVQWTPKLRRIHGTS